MARTRTLNINNLGGGVNDLYSEDDIAPSETTSTCRNIRVDGNKKKQRKGYISFADDLGDNTGIQVLSPYITADKTPDRLASVWNGGLYTINPEIDSAWTSLAVDGISTTNEVNMANLNGDLFIFDGENQTKRIDKQDYSSIFSNDPSDTYQLITNKGTEAVPKWSASTNTPALANGTGANGDYYIASDAGTANFGGADIDFVAGKKVVYFTDSAWHKYEKVATTQTLGNDESLAQLFSVSTGAGIVVTKVVLGMSAITVSTQVQVSIYNAVAGVPTTKVDDFGDIVYVNESINTYTIAGSNGNGLELADGDYAVVVTKPPYSSSNVKVDYSIDTTAPALLNTGAGWVAQTYEIYVSISGEGIELTTNMDITQPDAISSASEFTPAWGISTKGSLLVGGVPDYENTVFLARAGILANPEYGYDFSGTLGGASNADAFKFPSRATGAREMGDTIVMFDQQSAYFAQLTDAGTFVVKPLSGSQGAINFRSTVNVENDVFYLTPQNEIKSVRRATAENITAVVRPMSLKINKFLKSLDKDQSKAWSIYDQTEKLVKFYLRTEGASYTDVCVVGDVKNIDQYGNIPWTIDSAKPFYCGTFFKTKSYAGSVFTGQVYQDETGLADDDSAPIFTFFSTREISVDDPTSMKRFQNIEVHGKITLATNILVQIYVDDVLVKEGAMSGEDVFGGITAGIGTFGVGDEPIGTGGDLDPSEKRSFVYRFDFRATGQKMRVDFSTNEINQDYEISYLGYRIISLSKMYAPIGQKL